MSELHLGLAGFAYGDLFEIDGLQRLDQEFLRRLKARNPQYCDALLDYRSGERAFTPLEISEILLACAPELEQLIGELFGIQDEIAVLRARTLSHDPVFVFKKFFVQRRARRRLLKKEQFEGFAELDRWLDHALADAGLGEPGGHDRELAVAQLGQRLLADTEANKEGIEMLTRWCIRGLTVPEAKAAVRGWVSFRLPQGTDFAHLVPTRPVGDESLGRVTGPSEQWHARDGFKLTDPRMNAREVQAEIDYCVYCHDHDGDFCSKGFPEKKGEPEKGLKTNPLGVTLAGCPLDEKISEMHALKREGFSVAALGMIMVDNPMCPATGHRICNDCMKGCIYQKQQPVNIPQIETRALTDVLGLPWGVEIYDLLTRWNPLRRAQWLPKPYNGLKVLITGMGPAGFTLAHHLLMEGCAVVGIDGLKIEPLPERLITNPIRDYTELEEDLDSRIMTGFGGVAEYGITVRWDKNFLRLIYLTLARRPHFQVFGGIRFGGTLTLENARELGFDHVTIAVGAGLPQALPVPGSLAPGMRQANDFLMALQLTGAAKASSLANLQVRLPAVVIGGGLTGIDTATEVQAYYITQVEKVLERYERLCTAKGEARIREGLDEESLAVLEEYLAHGRAVRTERDRAHAAGESPDFLPLIQRWGGVTVAYRRRMKDSPAYTRNHEEVIKALEEGIYYAELLNPTAARLDQYGHVAALACQRMLIDENGKLKPTDEELELPATAIFVATGARPNIAYHFEHRGALEVQKPQMHYRPHAYRDGRLEPVSTVEHCKDPGFGAFTSYDSDGSRVTFIGDTHPDFNGSVVKAVASGMRIYPKIIESLGDRVDTEGANDEYQTFRARMEDLLQPHIDLIKRHTPSVVELRIRAPMAAKRFRPGQFFRLQNFETLAPLVDNTRLQTETLAVTGATVDPEAGHVSVMVLERGASSRLCATFKAGDPVVLMGPTGVHTSIPKAQTVTVVGDRLAAAAMLTLGPAFKTAGNRVLFVAQFDTAEDVFCQQALEAGSDAVIWVTKDGAPIETSRPQDRGVTGELGEVLLRYASGELHGADAPAIPLQEVDDLIIIGGSRLVRSVQAARCGPLHDYLTKRPKTTAAIYSSMQCMLKGVCSQCLQWQIDPETGQRTKAVFTCSWQDQPIDIVDFDNLDERLSQNRLQEHITGLWLDYLFEHHEIERI